MIPKIIHQVFFDFGSGELSDNPLFLKSHNLARSLPGYEYKLWNEEDSRELIKSTVPEYLNDYDNFRYKVMKVDFVRSVILMVKGGFYLDLDVLILKDPEPLRGLKILLHNYRHILPKWSYVENDVMGSRKGMEKFWLNFIKYSINQIREKSRMDIYNIRKGRYVLNTTGPYAFSRYVKKIKGLEPVPRITYSIHQGDPAPEELDEYYFRDYKTNSWINDKFEVK